MAWPLGRVAGHERSPCPVQAMTEAAHHRCCRGVCLLWLPAVAAGGCDGLTPHGRQLLTAANDNLAAGRYAAAEDAASAFLRQFPSSSGAGEAYYLRGLCRINQMRKEEGRSDLLLAVERAGSPDIVVRSLGELGCLAHEEGDDASAVSYFGRGESSFPPEGRTELFLCLYGTSLQRLGRWREARLVFARQLQAFPKGSRSAEARRRLAWTAEHFAIRCGAFESAERANESAGAWRAKGRAARVEFTAESGRGVWQVLVGQYPTYAEARAALPAIQESEPDATIVP